MDPVTPCHRERRQRLAVAVVSLFLTTEFLNAATPGSSAPIDRGSSGDLVAAPRDSSNRAPNAAKPASALAQMHESWANLPMSFESNEGQTDPQVKYVARGRGYALFLTSTEAVLSL